MSRKLENIPTVLSSIAALGSLAYFFSCSPSSSPPQKPVPEASLEERVQKPKTAEEELVEEARGVLLNMLS